MSPEDLRARKRALRTSMVERIMALDPAQRAREERVLGQRFATLPGFADAQVVLLYASAFPEEFATAPLLEQTLDNGKVLLCPRVDRAEHRLRLFRISDP